MTGCIKGQDNPSDVPPTESQTPEASQEQKVASEETTDEPVSAEPTVLRKGTVVLKYPGNGYKCTDTVFNKAKGEGERYSLELKESYPDEEYDDIQWLFENGFPDIRFNMPEGYYITTDHYNILRLDKNNDGYADRLEISDEEFNLVSSWDFTNFINPNNAGNDLSKERVMWAQESSDASVIYVSVCHLTYAQTQPDTGFIMAIDVNTGNILWKSQNLVCNTFNFYVKGDTIFTGYGFTDEDDYMYTLDARTGKVIDKISVSTCPNFIFGKEDKLIVKCYDCAYVYDIK